MQALKTHPEAAGLASCPTCSQSIDDKNRVEGEVLSCPGCSAELEVVGVSPLRLAEAPEVEEDWGE